MYIKMYKFNKLITSCILLSISLGIHHQSLCFLTSKTRVERRFDQIYLNSGQTEQTKCRPELS